MKSRRLEIAPPGRRQESRLSQWATRSGQAIKLALMGRSPHFTLSPLYTFRPESHSGNEEQAIAPPADKKVACPSGRQESRPSWQAARNRLSQWATRKSPLQAIGNRPSYDLASEASILSIPEAWVFTASSTKVRPASRSRLCIARRTSLLASRWRGSVSLRMVRME